jgi:hypothetical protein
VFRQKGIDVLLGHMDISKTDVDMPTTDLEQDLVDMTEAMARDTLSKPAGSKRGQIEVIIKREVIEKAVRPKKNGKQGNRAILDDEDCNTHEITVDASNKRHIRSTTVSARLYREDEEFFCKVCISYYDIAKLRTLGLCTRDGTPIDRRQREALALSSSPQSPGPLKRLRDSEPGRHEIHIDKTPLSDEEESASSDSTSDSDVPRRNKRRGAINSSRRKAKPRKNNKKMISWTARKSPESSSQTHHASQSSSASLVLPKFGFDLNDDGWARELYAELETPNATDNQLRLSNTGAEQEDVHTATGDMELIIVSNGTVGLSDEVAVFHEESE